MKIIKRSGSEVKFDAQKITAAITKANYEVPVKERLSKEQIMDMTNIVENICIDANRALSVEEIQDLVEEQIMDKRAFNVARKYITYRYDRALIRKSNSTDKQILSLLECNNEEVKQEFVRAVVAGRHREIARLIENSDNLLRKTLERDEEAVAKAIEEAHKTSAAPISYNNEEALRSTIRIAYISCMDEYITVDELPSGHGFADIAFIPKRNSSMPVILVEMKWNKTDSGAISQIKGNDYPQNLYVITGTDDVGRINEGFEIQIEYQLQ